MPSVLRAIEDRYPTFNFVVEIDGVAAAGFSELSGMEEETEVIEYREGGDATTPRKFRGLTKYPPLVLRRGQSSDLDILKMKQRTFDAFLGAAGFNSPVYRFPNMYIVQRDNSGIDVMRWRVLKAWISKYSISDFDALASEASFEEIEVSHEGFYLDNNASL